MRKTIFLILAVAATIANAAEIKLGNMIIDEDNVLNVGKNTLGLEIWGPDWEGSSEKSAASSSDGFPKVENGKSFTDEGVYELFNGSRCNFNKKFTLNPDGSIDVFYKLTNLASKTNEIAVTTVLPYPQFFDGIKVDEERVNLPQTYTDGMFNFSRSSVKKCELTGGKGVIIIESNGIGAYVQDNRKFKQENASLRLRLKKDSNGDYTINFKITYKPHTYSPLNMKLNGELNAGTMPRGYKLFGDVLYKIDEGYRCLEVAPDSEVVLNAPKNNETILYLLNAFETKEKLEGALATATALYEDGSKKEISLTQEDTNAFNQKSMYAVWRTFNENIGLRKMYSVKIPFPAGKIKSVTLKNISKAPWKIAAATLSTSDMKKESMVSYYVAEDENYAPYIPGIEIKKGSALDFSFLLDAPAGKYGFAKAAGDRIAFENKPDADLKLFGNNLCGMANYPSHEDSERLADVFARSGYNTVRLHHFDGPLVDMSSEDGVALLPERIERLDYLCAAMKKRGIYITIDVYISRVMKKSVLEDEFVYDQKTAQNRDIKPLFFLSNNAMKNWEKYASNLFNHVNPYTGLAWKEDPAIVSVSLINEDNISSIYYGKQKPVFDKKFKAWLEQKKLVKTPENERWLLEKFFHEFYAAAFNHMKDYLLKMGVKYMITDQNMCGGTSLSIMSEAYDIIDTHYYYGHPHFLEKEWRLPAKVLSTSALGENSGGGADKGTQIIAGKPFYMTEWSHVASNKNAAEGGFIMGAYVAMQGWNGLYRFAYSHSAIDFQPHISDYFNSSANPILALSDRAVSAFYLRGDVRKSDVVIPYLVARDTLDRPTPNVNWWKVVGDNAQVMKMLSLLARPETTLFDKIGDVKLPENSKFAVASEEGWITAMKGKKVFEAWTEGSIEAAAKELGCDVSNGVYKSATGQITQDKKNQTLLVETKNSEAYVGDEGSKIKGKFGRLSCTQSRSAVLVASVSEKSLNTSKRILILQLTDIKNTNMKYESDKQQILQEHGELPLLLASAKATLTLYRDLTGFKLYALDGTGERVGEIPMKISENKTVIHLRTLRDFGAVMAYELVME